MNFTQVAEQVGYDSIYYFSSLLKKRTGMTLTEHAKSSKDWFDRINRAGCKMQVL